MPPVSDLGLAQFAEDLEFDDRDVIVYCDGSADKEGNAGWSAVYFGRNGKVRQVFGWDSKIDHTSQAAEIRAAIDALRYLTRENVAVCLVSDSNYVVRCFNERWIPRWRKKGWVHQGKERPNRHLWETLEAYVELHDVEFVHVPGHDGEPGNEQCDMLANYAREKCRRERWASNVLREVAEDRRARDRAKQSETRGSRGSRKRRKRARG